MITVKRLMALLAECSPDTQVFAYEGEDTGMTLQVSRWQSSMDSSGRI